VSFSKETGRTSVVYTLNIGNYAPEVTALTYPLMEYYAKRIDADFYVITERAFPDWPIPVEKLQMGRLIEEQGRERAIYFDSDTLIHPELVNLFHFVPRDTVAHNAQDMANLRFKYDKYFLRDGRNCGTCGWLIITSDWTADLFHPPDITLDEALSRCSPTVSEANSGVIDREHLVDDLLMSRNLHRFGLKHMRLIDLWTQLGIPNADFFHHIYTEPVEHKVGAIRDTIGKGKFVCPVCRRLYYLSYCAPKQPGVCDQDGASLILSSWNIPDGFLG